MVSAGAGKVLLAGAGGRLGRQLLAELRRRGLAARALVRDPARLAAEAARGVEIFTGDARRPATLAGVCDGASAVVSALGASLRLGRTRDGATYREADYLANLNLLAEALKARARKFVYVSLHEGAGALSGTAYADAHEAFVRELKASGVDYAVVRPTGFFYVFAEFMKMARRGRAVVVGDGSARTNPVHERDVARACVECLGAPARELSVGGPDIFTRREIAALAFRVLGRRPKVTSVPAPLARALALPVRLFDPRLYDLLDFGVAASTVDVIAPQVGTHRLEEYFREIK